MDGRIYQRPLQYQFTNRRGAILHVSPEYPGIKVSGNTGSIVGTIVEHQRDHGFDSHVVIPGSPGVTNAGKEYIHVLGESFKQTYPYGREAYDQMRAFSMALWKFIESGGLEIAVMHVHDAMGMVFSFRPVSLTGIRSIYSIYGPQENSPLDYSFPSVNPDLEYGMGSIHHGVDSALRAGVEGAIRPVFWSRFHRMDLLHGVHQYFLEHQIERGTEFITLPGDFRPVESPTPPEQTIFGINQLYHRMIYGKNGVEFAHRALNEPNVPIKTMVYICNETVSTLVGRTSRTMKMLKGDHRIRDTISEVLGYGRGLHNDFDQRYRGALGTFVFLINEGVARCDGDHPIFIGLNGSGMAKRETPITQQEKGDKGAAMVGNRSLNQIVTLSCEMVAKQLPPGDWLILAASDNAFAGRITVGEHLLSEDEHGIINLTVPEQVLGEGITTGDKKLKHLEQLGIVLVDKITGAVLGFKEKISVVKIQELARKAKQKEIDMNSMVKLIRRDIAALYGDDEHYNRPSYRTGEPFLFTYAGQMPDWSKLHDEPVVSSNTLEKWMGSYSAKSGYDRRDWRLFWLIANDIVLSSLESIALQEKYFGGIANLSSPVPLNENSKEIWEEIRGASIEIMSEFGGFNDNGDAPPENWYFKRCRDFSLRANWKELFLACRAVKNQFSEGAKDEWMKRKPDGVEYDLWKTVWETALKLDEKENGLAAGRIDGFWLDTGTKREFFNAWQLLVDENPDKRAVARTISDVREGSAVDHEVEGQESLVIPNRDHVYIGGSTSFKSTKGGKIHIGSNVVIVNSTIYWTGEGDLHIPSNTVIYDSRIEEIDPKVSGDGATLIYRFNGKAGRNFEIETPTGEKSLKFGFYDGVMFGSMRLNNGTELSTIFPLDLNLNNTPDNRLLEDNISNEDLRYHFMMYFGSGAVTRSDFDGLGEEKVRIWDDLIQYGYIDPQGNILPKFNDQRGFLLTDLPLTKEQIESIFKILKKAQDGREAYTKNVPFTGMRAADILKNIGF